MSRFRRRPDINETPVENEIFLIADNSGDIYHLDQLAMSIWRALDRPSDEDELVELFAQAFPDTPAETLRRDLRTALATLKDGGLIEVCD